MKFLILLVQFSLIINKMGIGAQILLWLVIIHFIVGFGYVMYKLSPRKGDKKDPDLDSELEK